MTPNEKLNKLLADIRLKKALELRLSKSDYKVIKCYEYSLAGLDLPYDIEALHAERESIREEIRQLEEE
jgi:hypothetical protein